MLFLTKMVLGAVLLSGLISISSYASFANATTNATTTDTNKIITGNTEQYRTWTIMEFVQKPQINVWASNDTELENSVTSFTINSQ